MVKLTSTTGFACEGGIKVVVVALDASCSATRAFRELLPKDKEKNRQVNSVYVVGFISIHVRIHAESFGVFISSSIIFKKLPVE